MVYENFYIKAPKALLDAPLPLKEFLKEDGSYMTIPEYLSTFNHTVTRYSNDDSYFIKGFGFNLAGLDELRGKLADFNLTLDKDIWILSPGEVQEELTKDIWQLDKGLI